MATETIAATAQAGTASPAAAPPDPVLDELLDAELAFDPVTRGGFINHIAMGLVAARRLGATDEELHAWYDRIARNDMLIERGLPDWLDPERRDVAERGLEIVTAEQLPRMVAAPSSQLFHAPIRLELALDAGHAGQVANALHNWGQAASPIEPPPDPGAEGSGDRTFAEVLAALHRDTGGRRVEASDPTFRRGFDSLAVTDALLDEVAHAVAAAHATDGNFWTLHLVTGTRAVRALAPLLDDDTRTELAVRTAHAVALLWLGTDPTVPDESMLDRYRSAAPRDWTEIGRAAVENRDAHVIKLAYACLREEESTGDALYPWLAARESGLI